MACYNLASCEYAACDFRKSQQSGSPDKHQTWPSVLPLVAQELHFDWRGEQQIYRGKSRRDAGATNVRVGTRRFLPGKKVVRAELGFNSANGYRNQGDHA